MGDRLQVIYVDDEPDIRTIVEMALGLDPDIDLRIAESGRQALAMLDTGWVPDIALLDLMMPEMSGKDLLGHIRARPEFAQLPVVFVTASARQDDVDRYRREGADGVIIKPFDPLALAQTVRAEFARIAGHTDR